jgi:acetylornithine deacetylase/succinyl-diaminopimelate desuccinylase-like protein
MSSDALRTKIQELMPRAKADLTELVAFRSVADPQQEPPEECAKAADWVVKAFADVGLQDVKTSLTSDGSACVTGIAPGPEGAPTVLLYSHYDVQPPLGDDAWETPVWTLTEREDGRWYGRGTADCKGNVVMHLTALRALQELDGGFPCTIKVVVEGSEEQGTGGLEHFVTEHVELLRADTICVVDAGNAALGTPTLTTTLRGMTAIDITVEALGSAMHSGMFGGPAPDPIAAMMRMLASLHDDAGNTTVDGLDNTGTWDGLGYPADRFRSDATVLDGVDLIGDGAVADMLWSRYAATIIGIDVPPVVGSANAVQASCRARVSLRVPPGAKAAEAQEALIAHLQARVPWNLRSTVEHVANGDPWAGSLDGPGFDALKKGLEEAYGAELATEGQGGSIPLCNVLQETYPDAEIMLYGVEEPTCLIHAPNESVHPSEIEHIALAEALFLRNYGRAA